MKAAWIALAMIVACGAWGQSQPPAPTPSKQSDPHQQQATHEQQPSTDSQRGTENAPFVVKAMDGNKTDKASAKTENESGRKSLIWGMIPDYATAVFTGLLVAIGAATAIVLGFQSWLLRRQVKLAREEFNSTHRPKIRMKHLWLHRPVIAGQEILVDLVVVNHGDTPARNVHGQIAMALAHNIPSLPAKPSFDGRPFFGVVADTNTSIAIRGEVRSGLTIEFNGLPTGRSLATQEFSALLGEEINLYCFGYVEYADMEGRVRKTAFFRSLTLQSNGNGRFLETRGTDPDYQYQD
jgi:hypothetical protein